jgi:hypothetical protein
MPGTRPGMTNEGFATGLKSRSPGWTKNGFT